MAIRGVLLDIDGVLHLGMQPISGAADTLRWLDQHGYATCFVTNTTTSSRVTLVQQLQAIGLPIAEERVMTAPVATASYIRQHYPGKRVWLLTKGNTAEDFWGIDLVQDHADLVIIGGAEELFTYEAMNHAFRMLVDGAQLLATHANLYWRTLDGLQLDSGAYIRALEAASDQHATILGKPDRAFFEQALRSINIPAREAVMIGDDIENDIGGAQHAGLCAVLVCTGKHNRSSQLLERIRPDAILESVRGLPAWLEQQGT